VDTAVEEYDTGAVREIVKELDKEDADEEALVTFPGLSSEDINLGRFSVAKVSDRILNSQPFLIPASVFYS
jgi:hypothetical protein